VKALGFIWCAVTVVVFMLAMAVDELALFGLWIGVWAFLLFLFKAGESAVRR